MASLTDEVPNQQPLENGYHGSSSGKLIQYKKRKVSAVRSFPPKCGINAEPVTQEALLDVIVCMDDHVAPVAQDNSVQSGIIAPEALLDVMVCIDDHVAPAAQDNSVQSEIIVEAQSRVLEENKSIARGLEASGEMEFQENGVVQHPDYGVAVVGNNVIETEAKKSPDGLEAVDLGLPKSTEQNSLTVPHGNATLATTCDVFESEAAKTEAVVDKVDSSILTSEMENQFDEAVGCPIFLEKNVSLDDFVEDAFAMVIDSIDNQIHGTNLDFNSLQVELLEDIEGNGADLVKELSGKDVEVKGIGEDEIKPSMESCVVADKEIQVADKAFQKLRDKSSRRKIPVSRDFPPNCGKNGPPLTEVERAKIFYETETLSGGKREYLQTELQNSKEALESGKLRKTSSIMVEAGGLVKATDAGTEESDRNLIEVVVTNDNVQIDGLVEKEVFLDAPDTYSNVSSSGLGEDKRVIVAALMAAPNRPWIPQKVTVSSEGRKTERKVDKVYSEDRKTDGRVDKVNSEDRKTELEVDKVGSEVSKIERKVDKVGSEDGKTELKVDKKKPDWRKKSGVVAKKSIAADSSNRSPLKKQKNSPPVQKDVVQTSHALVVKDGARSDKLQKVPTTGPKKGFIVNIPPFGSSSSQHTDARNKVKEMLRLYHTICRKLMQGEEAKSGKFEKTKRIDLEAKKILDEKGVEINTDKDRIGSVPGVEVGDEFQYRVELAIVGVHRLYQAGIDYIKQDGKVIATSIVASGAYADGWDNADVLIYSGQGGNVVGKKRKEPEDQKLERGNLALSNSVKTKNPVRVVRGSKEAKASDSQDSKSSKVMTTSYVYDGLYTVEKCWPETGPHGKMVYMFELRRIPGQPDLAWKEVKNAKVGKVRRGVCVTDISGGLEKLPICAVNLIDDEKPPAFTYIREMKYPGGFHFILPQGCSCTTRCSDSRKCSCRPRNGGELPYNRNGAIVEVKPIVYECGPSCKCPPTCYNRVSQHGIKIQLEIFKTENRGWGVRSLASIPSGSFICEYAGELLDDREAELRTGSDEYLFDIGKNNNPGPDEVVETVVEEAGGYTVDAAVYGNVGRFINHSCSPNLYAQDVLYDHNDKKMPHVMLFAADNIPPLKELTYDYNYSMNTVHDSNGNIKMKSCYCGSTECRGRLY